MRISKPVVVLAAITLCIAVMHACSSAALRHGDYVMDKGLELSLPEQLFIMGGHLWRRWGLWIALVLLTNALTWAYLTRHRSSPSS